MDKRTDLMIRHLREELADEVRGCRRCKDMNEHGVTQAAPGWGNEFSPVVIVGQSLCEQCMAPQEPFFEGSASLLELAYKQAGCEKSDLFITNAVHCHPPGNRKSHTHEIVNCAEYLYRELDMVRPQLVICLGDDAKRVLNFFYPGARNLEGRWDTPKNVRSKVVPFLYFVKHPSWMKRPMNAPDRDAYVTGLAEAIKWARSKGPLQPVVPYRTCEGMVPDLEEVEGNS